MRVSRHNMLGLGTALAVGLGSGRSAVVNIWVDPNEYALGTKAQTMYK